MNSTSPPGSMRDQRIFTILAGLMGIHLVVRAVEVPITFEEATRFFTYVLPAGLPTEHVLSVVWAKLVGPELLGQRLLSLLLFPVLAMYTFRLGGLVEEPLVRWSVRLSLLIMPFAVETFALAGGHGPAMAFLLMGLWHVRAIGTGAHHVGLASLGFALVGISAKALWPLWILGQVAVAIATQRRAGAGQLARILPGILLPAAWLWTTHTPTEVPQDIPVMAELRTWVELVLGTRAHAILWLLVAAVATMAAVAFLRKGRTGTPGEAFLLRTVVVMLVAWPAGLLATGPLTDLQHDLLPWLPLFLLGLALALDEAGHHAPHRRWLSLLLLVPPVIMLSGIHVGTTRASTDGAIPRSFHAVALQLQAEAGQALVIAGDHRQAPSWNFGALHAREPLSLLQTERDRWAQADVLVAHREAVAGMAGFREVVSGPSGLVMLARDPAVPRQVIHSTALTWEPSDAEFRELPLPTPDALRGHDLVLDLMGPFALEGTPREGPFLVMEMNDADMGHLHYSSKPLLPLLRSPEGRGRITFALPPVPPEAQRVAVYIWNPSRVALSAREAHLHLLERDHPAHQPVE